MKNIVLAVAFSLVMAVPAFAQTTADMCKDGTVATIRISKITGTKAGFEEAAKAQADWYVANGHKDNKIVVVPVILEPKDSKPAALEEKEMVTIHYNPPSAKGAFQRNAAWDEFVAKFRANSEIVSERIVCMPK